MAPATLASYVSRIRQFIVDCDTAIFLATQITILLTQDRHNMQMW